MISFGEFVKLVRKLDRLIHLEETHGKAIADSDAALRAVSERLLAIDRRLQRLENREDVVMNEAKSAARAGAHEAMSGHVAEMSRRITLLEAGHRPSHPTPSLTEDPATGQTPETRPRRRRRRPSTSAGDGG